MADVESIGRLRYDEVIIEKQGGNAELTIKNATRGINGFLYNLGDGLTEFRESAIGTQTFEDDNL